MMEDFIVMKCQHAQCLQNTHKNSKKQKQLGAEILRFGLRAIYQLMLVVNINLQTYLIIIKSNFKAIIPTTMLDYHLLVQCTCIILKSSPTSLKPFSIMTKISFPSNPSSMKIQSKISEKGSTRISSFTLMPVIMELIRYLIRNLCKSQAHYGQG